MKRVRDLILSSGSSSDEASPSHPSQKIVQRLKSSKMAEVTEASDVTLRDIFMQLNGIKRDFDSSFGDLRQDIQTTRIELQRDIKIIRDEVDEFKKSLENVWAAVDDDKEKIALHAQEIASLKSACATLKDEVNLQRQKNLQLERYTRRENIRLLYLEEKDEEDTEELFIRCLTEMNVYDPQMSFHAVHRVGQQRKRKGGPNVTQAPRHIIARFLSRKDRDLVWKNREKIKETEHFKDAFFVPDLCKQDAEEGFKLRQALRCARNVFKMKVEIRNNRLLMVDSGLSYSLQELPEYLKKELRQDK